MRSILTISFLTVVLIGLISGHANADDWPQFLGPDRNGVSTETGLIDTWPDTGPEVLWRTPLGVSMSGVSVANGAAFTMFQDETFQYVVSPSWKPRARHQLWPTDICLYATTKKSSAFK